MLCLFSRWYVISLFMQFVTLKILTFVVLRMYVFYFYSLGAHVEDL